MNAIEVSGLSFTYPDGTPGLQGVAFSVPEGASLALVGPNGAGKSTLMLHLNGLLDGGGEVRVLGKPVSEDVDAARQAVGLVFQNPEDQLFMPTIFDDVAFGPLNLGWPVEKVREEVDRALQAVGLGDYGHRSPHHLSLGEKKRASIATVLVMDCRILVLDEPTSGLDPRGRWELTELLNRLHTTKIIATHSLDFARATCNEAIVMDRGEIVARGPASEILEDGELLARHGLAPPQTT
jgi:cobalt/nickel transport system ATP-binding protein